MLSSTPPRKQAHSNRHRTTTAAGIQLFWVTEDGKLCQEWSPANNGGFKTPIPGSMDSSAGLPKSSCCLKHQGQGLSSVSRTEPPVQCGQLLLPSLWGDTVTQTDPTTQDKELVALQSLSPNISRRQGQLQRQPTCQKTHIKFYALKKLTFIMLLFREETERESEEEREKGNTTLEKWGFQHGIVEGLYKRTKLHKIKAW